jgi:putative flippase GtrA
MFKMNDTLIKFGKFSIVGFVNTASSYLLFFILLKFAHVNYLVSSVSSYILGILISYFGNKYWTFRSIRSVWRLEFIKYMILNIIGLALNTLIMFLMVENYKLNPYVAQIVAMSVVIFYNFFGSKFWVFREMGKI